MKYLMLVISEPVAQPVAGQDDVEPWVEEHDASGARFFGDRLADVSQSKTVRIRREGTMVTDGPFAEGHEHIAGLDILECDSIDEAVQVALGHPMARHGALEVRPFYDWDAEEGS